jgi:hypothetical protein
VDMNTEEFILLFLFLSIFFVLPNLYQLFFNLL